jgi:hypothetical protein
MLTFATIKNYYKNRLERMSLNYEDVDDLTFNDIYNVVNNVKYDINDLRNKYKNNGKMLAYIAIAFSYKKNNKALNEFITDSINIGYSDAYVIQAHIDKIKSNGDSTFKKILMNGIKLGNTSSMISLGDYYNIRLDHENAHKNYMLACLLYDENAYKKIIKLFSRFGLIIQMVQCACICVNMNNNSCINDFFDILNNDNYINKRITKITKHILRISNDPYYCNEKIDCKDKKKLKSIGLKLKLSKDTVLNNYIMNDFVNDFKTIVHYGLSKNIRNAEKFYNKNIGLFHIMRNMKMSIANVNRIVENSCMICYDDFSEYSVVNNKIINADGEEINVESIKLDVIKHPVYLSCGHGACYDCIKKYFENKNECFCCKKNLVDDVGFSSKIYIERDNAKTFDLILRSNKCFVEW